MITIDTKAYIVRMIMDIINFYLLFFLISDCWKNKKKSLSVLFFIPLTFFVQIFTEVGDIVPILGSYLVLKTKGKVDQILLNTLIICMLIVYSVSLISSVAMLHMFSHEGIKGYGYISIQIGINFFLILFFAGIYRKLGIKNFVSENSSKSTTILMIYLFLISFFISYASHYYEVFDRFILGAAILLIVQTIFVLFLFIRTTLRQKERYEQQLKIQELDHLKTYTEQLEKDQERLAKFRHDYKNLLLSIKELSSLNKNFELTEQIQQLEDYSNSHIASTDFDYKYLKNVKNDYIKSLLISKFYQANEAQIHCHFECLKPIEKIPIPIFDCVRILGIILDNAIEAALESEERKISLLIYRDDRQVEFLIVNSSQEMAHSIDSLVNKGISTKKDHEGLGLNTVQEINEKNSNMFIQYKKDHLTFTTQVILMWQ